jgi:hypothetical protein
VGILNGLKHKPFSLLNIALLLTSSRLIEQYSRRPRCHQAPKQFDKS